MFLDGEFSSFQQVACLSAWWQMDAQSIRDYLVDFKIDFPQGATLFELLWASMTATLHNLSEEDILDRIYRRLCKGKVSRDATNALLQIDEAVEVLEKQDEQMVRQQQDSEIAKKEARKSFKKQYFAKAQAVSG